MSDPTRAIDPAAVAETGYVSRRSMLKATAAIASVPAMSAVMAQQSGSPSGAMRDAEAATREAQALKRVDVELTVNGRAYKLNIDTRTTVLDALRENLNFKGSKKGCDHGQCGACTVLIDGRRINSCLTLAVMHDGQQITTIEGLASSAVLHPMQAAFIKHDGFQCGYCTPGQICSSVGMLTEARAGMPSHVTGDLLNTSALNDEEIRERMSGNICRCSAYPNIVAAIKEVAAVQA